MAQYNGFHVIDLHEDEHRALSMWHARDSTKLCHPTNKSAYSSIIIIIVPFVWPHKKEHPIEIEKYSPNVNPNLRRAIFVMNFELHAQCPKSLTEKKNYEQKKVLKKEVLFRSQSYIMRDKLISILEYCFARMEKRRKGSQKDAHV